MEQPRVPAGSPQGGQWAKSTSTIVAYHGTSNENTESILATGLKSFEDPEPVFVTTDKAEASRYAGYRDPRGPVVIEVHIPPGTSMRTEKSDKSHILLEKPVPKEWIKGLVPEEFGKKFDATAPNYKNHSGRKSAEEIARHEDRQEMTKWISHGFSSADVSDELKRREKARK